MIRIKVLFTFITLLLAMSLYAQPVGRSRTIAAIQQQILPMLKRNQIPGATVVIYDHGYPYAFYYGTASLRRNDKVTGDTTFEIASVSKLFTSILLAEESQAGKVNLNSPMSNYIQGLPSNSSFSRVTLQNLAAHVNGFGNMPEPRVRNRNELLRSLQYWKPHYQCGTWWSYSNVAFGLLGYALEDATHQSYYTLLRQDIFNPLHMTDAKLVSMNSPNGHCAQGYGWGGLAVSTTPKLLIIPAAGSIQASGNDMLKFMAGAMDLPGTPPKVAKAIKLTEQPIYQTSYGAQGLGWEVHDIRNISKWGYLKNKSQFVTLHSSPVTARTLTSPNAHLIFDKTGSVAGFRSYVVIVPSEQTGIVVMVNRAMSRTSLVTATRRTLMMLLSDDGVLT